MNQSELVAKYAVERPILQEWANFVLQCIQRELRSAIGNQDIQSILKVPASSRLKSTDGLVEKAFYRGKEYTNPYEDITDKVGIRFVVLLLEHIRLLGEIIDASAAWTARKDRDFELERQQRPAAFEYQSVHYVVWSVNSFDSGGVTVPAGIPCEVQIRTLLQHAFSELTHDTVYKPRSMSVPAVFRDIAKSMALIETTDELFASVSRTIREADVETQQWSAELEILYSTLVKIEPATNPRANALIIESLFPELGGLSAADVKAELEGLPVDRWISERAESNFLFRQPAILLAYFLADRSRYALRKLWPFTYQELNPVLTDLGRAS